MRSVADGLRAQTRAENARLEPLERIRLALELGDADVAALAASRGLTTDVARQTIARSRRVGRVASVSATRDT